MVPETPLGKLIEGIRLLPFYQEAIDQRLRPKDCETCMRTTSIQTRRELGCAYEPALERATPWTPRYWVDKDLAATVCPGYTTTLPEVAEVVEAFPQWEKGALTEHLDGEPPTRALLDLLRVMKAGISEFEMSKIKKDGG